MQELPLFLSFMLGVIIQALWLPNVYSAYLLPQNQSVCYDTAPSCQADPSNTKMTWDEGREICRRWNGYLARPETFTKSQIRGWSDLTRKHGYIQSESAADEEALAALSRNEEWAPYILSPQTHSRKVCFAALYKRDAFNRVVQRPCDEPLEGLCSLPTKDGSLNIPRCPRGGWLDIDTRSKCFWYNSTGVSQGEAQRICESHGGQLALFKGYSSTDTLFTAWRRSDASTTEGPFWIHPKTGADGRAKAANWEQSSDYRKGGRTLRVNGTHDAFQMKWSTTEPWTRHPFICEAPLKAGTPWLRAGMERAGDSVTFTCHTSPEIIEGSIMWFKDGLAIKGNRVTPDSSSHTLTLPSATRNSPYLQGYYWCEGISIDGFKEVESRKRLLQFADLETFIGSWNITTTDNIPGLDDVSSQSFINFARTMRQDIIRLLWTVTMTSGKQTFGANALTEARVLAIKQFGYNEYNVRFAIYYRTSGGGKPPDQESMTKMTDYALRLSVNQSSDYNIVPDSAEINVAGICLNGTTQDTDVENGCISLEWPETIMGDIATPLQPCVGDNGVPVLRKCEGNYTTGAYWGPVQGSCQEVPSGRSLDILKLLRETLNSYNVLSAAVDLRNFTSDTNELLPQDVVYAVQTLVNIASVPHISEQVAENVLGSISSIIQANSTSLYLSRMAGTTNKVLWSMEQTAANLENYIVVLNGSTGIGKLSVPETGPGVYLSAADKKWIEFSKAEELTEHAEVAIVFPPLRSSDAPEIENLNLTFGLLSHNALFGNYSDAWHQKCTQIIQLKYPHREPEGAVFSFYFRHKCNKTTSATQLIAECVFWDIHANDEMGDWSSEGCTYVGMVEQFHVCNCTHLTSFGIIFKEKDVLIDDIHETVLSYLTLIGIAPSLFGLLAVILTYAISKGWKKGVGYKCLLNLSISLLGALFVFALIVMTQNGLRNSYACIGMGVIMHYLLLVAFSWTLVEALLQYLRFVKVLGTYIPHLVLKCGLPAWGVPLVVVTAVVSYDPQNYNSRQQLCWPQGRPLLYGFFLPVGLILAVNIVVFIMIIYSIYCRRQQVARNNQQWHEQAKLKLRATVCVVFLLGLTWIFAYASTIDAHGIGRIFEYLFVVSSTLQGFAIFMFHVACDKTAQQLWKDKFADWRCRSTESGRGLGRHEDQGVSQHEGNHFNLDGPARRRS
ncbi:adhesion G-protein coupled receptor G6-like [Ornithodoros turicata]|uniref:adhesion G-protein coupled receptor G6-like n=1 Tax=Ornithodoros turicata TaxID=34597 RepID=UPI003139800E